MLSNNEILPNIGYGNIEFGIPMNTFMDKYGEPEEIDTIGEDEDYATTVLHYWDKSLSIFFVGITNPVLAGIETDHIDSTLYGVKIMNKSKEEIISLMKKNGLSSYDEGDDEFVSENEIIRVSYEESMMDFFFQDDDLIFMNFGVMVDDNGNIEKV
ncbi:MAG: hypothetical protein QM503_13990 [Bacteroidota bacterium]